MNAKLTDHQPGIVSEERYALGEGPTWWERREELVWVDITGRRVFRSSLDRDEQWCVSTPGDVGAAIPCRGGTLVLAVGHQLLLCQDDEIGPALATVESDRDDNRFNDCRCDPQGRLWAGTMSRSRQRGTAALYRLEAGGAIERVIAETTISNGLGWSPDGERMYFVDSPTQRLDVLDFDGADGSVSERRPLVRIDPALGLPDGLCVDAEGGIWVALFGGGAVHRYSPKGELTEVVPLPTTNPTCPAFGGPARTTLYVTTARHKLSPEQLAAKPLAGALLAFDAGVAGLPATPFAL